MFTWFYGPALAQKSDRLGTYAAALAYCFVLSLIPFLVITFTLGTELTPKKNLQELVNAYSDILVDIFPGQVSDPALATVSGHAVAPSPSDVKHRRGIQVASLSVKILDILQNKFHRGLTAIGFAFAIYTSFNLMGQIVRTLLFIFDDPRKPQDWTAVHAFKTIALFLIWMLLLLVFAACSVVSPIVATVLREVGLSPVFWNTPLAWLSYLSGMGLLFAAFFLTYYLVPTKGYSLSRIRDGSLVAAFGWALCSFLFAHVLPEMWNTNAVYEALGSIVIILLWAQACAWSVIVGACWIVRFPTKRRDGKRQADK